MFRKIFSSFGFCAGLILAVPFALIGVAGATTHGINWALYGTMVKVGGEVVPAEVYRSDKTLVLKGPNFFLVSGERIIQERGGKLITRFAYGGMSEEVRQPSEAEAAAWHGLL